MFRTRARKIVRDVIARKGRTALVSAAIFIGVTGTIALFSMRNILIGQLKEDIKEIRNSKPYKDLLEKQLNFDFNTPVCSKCDNSFDSSLDWVC